MSRRGPEYVVSEAELFQDLERKQRAGEISEKASQDFTALYEFAKDMGDDVRIGEAKNANFRMYVNAHQGSYQNDPSVFSTNVSGLVKIWPAYKPLGDETKQSPVGWQKQDYVDFRQNFQSLRGVPQGDQEVSFSTVVEHDILEQFKSAVEEFAQTCRQKA